jgi:nucleotide-binding universal stress UspA family protein
MSNKKILIPVDFSDQSLIALDQSYNLARQYKAEITLLYVIEDNGFISKLFSKQQDDDIKKQVEENLLKLATDVEKKTGIHTNTMVARGSVYEKIAEVADMINALFIIMGAHGRINVRKQFIGSNALRVVREANVPVITIRGQKHRDGCKNIVLPLDLTKETREKVNFAIELAKLGNRSAIRIVSVLFTSDEFVVNRLTRQLQQVKNFIEKEGVECTAEIIKGVRSEESLSESIIKYAHKVDGDLLMIMTQQEVDFTQRFIGSSAQEIINNSDIPVISIIPSMKRDFVFKPY